MEREGAEKGEVKNSTADSVGFSGDYSPLRTGKPGSGPDAETH